MSLGVLTAVFAPIAGRSMDRFGARWVMAIGLAIIALGFFLRASMTSLWQAICWAPVSSCTARPGSRDASAFGPVRSNSMGGV